MCEQSVSLSTVHPLSVDRLDRLAVTKPGVVARKRKKGPRRYHRGPIRDIRPQAQSRISASRFAIARSVRALARAQAALSPEGQFALR